MAEEEFMEVEIAEFEEFIEALNCDGNDTVSLLAKSFRRLSLIIHPDKSKTEERFSDLVGMYNKLKYIPGDVTIDELRQTVDDGFYLIPNDWSERNSGYGKDNDQEVPQAVKREHEHEFRAELSRKGQLRCGKCRLFISKSTYYCNPCGIQLLPTNNESKLPERAILVRGKWTCPNCHLFVAKKKNQCSQCLSQYLPPKSSQKYIVTHDGNFHCDEALACYMLKQVDEFKDYQIIRSRDKSLWTSENVLVDVGGQYDHSKRRYDHHQKSFEVTMATICGDQFPNDMRLSSAGLIYAHYGKEVISKILSPSGISPELVDVIFPLLYSGFLEAIDANDNGHRIMRYMPPGSIVEQVSNLNPRWDEPKTEEEYMARFEKAMKRVGEILEERLDHLYNHWWKARLAVKEHMEEYHGGGYLYFDLPVPWKKHYFSLEDELYRINPKINELSFVIVKDAPDNYQFVPIKRRGEIPKAWLGCFEEEILERTGVENCKFIHSEGHIAITRTLQAAVALVEKAIQSPFYAVCVNDFSDNVTEQTLRVAFERFGVVKSVKIAPWNNRRCGYCNFFDAPAARDALTLNGSDLNGSQIRVRPSYPLV